MYAWWCGWDIMRRRKRGGETTERVLPHIGVSAHDTAMAQNTGAGGGATVPGGDVMSEWGTGWGQCDSPNGPTARRLLTARPHEVPGKEGGRGFSDSGCGIRGWGGRMYDSTAASTDNC